MALVFQLSDLHLLASPVEQEAIFDELVATMRELAAGASEPVGLLAITGDVFDSSTVDATMAAHRFKMLHKEMCRSLGGDVPTVIIPGNHDRRRNGLFGPHREELFQTLRVVLGDRAWVHGCSTPFLCELIPSDYHKLPFFVLAYDSTYLPSGMLSAGGALRQEDLLEAAAQMGEENPDRPVMVLIHHHLVPTPITDLGPVPLDEKSGRLLRWGVQKALPALVSNADREELTMTAMGAGTALSTLHTLGRAVLVLHGHKHYATARLLEGITVGQGDVLIEFVTPAITTGGDDTPYGPYYAPMIPFNPHIKYYEGDRRGYFKATVTEDYLLMDLHLMTSVVDPAGTGYLETSFVVEDGVPGAQPA